ncbi:hypothetical protein D3F13_24210 [Salmonella enterica subsp. enterica serovar Emek]|nr:hypothetical protein [Salmonella enterica subsp. enterica serovar Emek]
MKAARKAAFLFLPIARIYHNPFLRAPRKRPQGVSDGKPVKQATNHPKTRQKRAGSVFTACMSMRTSA